MFLKLHFLLLIFLYLTLCMLVTPKWVLFKMQHFIRVYTAVRQKPFSEKEMPTRVSSADKLCKLFGCWYHVSSADNNLCKQFGSRSGPPKCRAWSGSKLFDTDWWYSWIIFSKVLILTKKSADENKITKNNPACKELRFNHWSLKSTKEFSPKGLYYI